MIYLLLIPVKENSREAGGNVPVTKAPPYSQEPNTITLFLPWSTRVTLLYAIFEEKETSSIILQNILTLFPLTL